MAAKTALLPTGRGPSRHIDLFCPLEQYPREHLRLFCPLEGVAERHFLPCFVHWNNTLKNTFNMFNSTRPASEGELCVCLLLERHPSGHFTSLKEFLIGHVTQLSPMEGHLGELSAELVPLGGTVLCHWHGSIRLRPHGKNGTIFTSLLRRLWQQLLFNWVDNDSHCCPGSHGNKIFVLKEEHTAHKRAITASRQILTLQTEQTVARRINQLHLESLWC